MFNMSGSEEIEEPPSRSSYIRLVESYEGAQPNESNGADKKRIEHEGFLSWVLNMVHKPKSENSPETLKDYMERTVNGESEDLALHEKTLISNIINLRDLTVIDVMIPRADIDALEISTSQQDLLSFFSERQFSRLPIYRETLDDVVGTIHIKDIMACLAQGRPIVIEELVRDVPIVSPALPILDLILLMKQERKHMALVVDEYGGIDGLVTIGDVIEVIIGEVEDEYDQADEPQIFINEDGSVLADGRLDVSTFEEKFGDFLSEDEKEDIDTLGGLVFSLAGRIPARGEVLAHPSGLVFEIIDADPRRVNKVLVKNTQGD